MKNNYKNRFIKYTDSTLVFIGVISAIIILFGLGIRAGKEKASADALDSTTQSSRVDAGYADSSTTDSETVKQIKIPSTIEGDSDISHVPTVEEIEVSRDGVVEADSQSEGSQSEDSTADMTDYDAPEYPAEQSYDDYESNVPNWDECCDSNRKLYMYYTSVTCEASDQYKLLYSDYCKTDPNTGIRMYGGRYCIALGSYYTTQIGQKVDVVLENGNIIPCVLGDCKADIHTNATHQYNWGTGNVVEFIVDPYVFDYLKDDTGTCNWIWGFDGKVTRINLVD